MSARRRFRSYLRPDRTALGDVNSGKQPANHSARLLGRDRIGVPDCVAPADPLSVPVLDHVRERTRCAVGPPALLSQAKPSKLSVPVDIVPVCGMRSHKVQVTLCELYPIAHRLLRGKRGVSRGRKMVAHASKGR
jgi:hypothetical protein